MIEEEGHERRDTSAIVRLDAKIDLLGTELKAMLTEQKLTLEAGQRDISQRLDFQTRTDETARAGLRTDIDRSHERITLIADGLAQFRAEHARFHETEREGRAEVETQRVNTRRWYVAAVVIPTLALAVDIGLRTILK